MAGETKYLARDLTIEVLDPSSGGSLTEIKGVETFTHGPSSTVADTTDYQSAGHKEGLMAERGDEFTLKGYRLENITTGDRDPGQLIVEELAQQISVGSIGTFRVTTPGGHTLDFSAMAEVTLPGGGHNAPAEWGAKLTVTGAIAFDAAS